MIDKDSIIARLCVWDEVYPKDSAGGDSYEVGYERAWVGPFTLAEIEYMRSLVKPEVPE